MALGLNFEQIAQALSRYLVISFPGSTWERSLQVLPEYCFKAEP
ncbi:hypothetical protein VL20_35 [Microcystis panniformis FACHB-1757]|uniref:Uncharacterized protein n=1 Tax=Microcystis panniformis FACHB-1757 TaxID=1638788 RepID=A0A0K1RTQ9_9CHRO|nr:hypothetical protein VL20_35 [Microcystis panniformis FACHB-1757]